MDIGQRIKKARKKAGLTQRELAEGANVATVSIQQYERGARQPRIEQLQAISAALGVQVVDLLGPYDGPPLPGLADGDKLEEAEAVRYSPSKKRVNAAMDKLNSDGQQKAVERVEELTEIPRYQAQTPASAPPPAPEGTDATPPPEGSGGPPEGK